MTLASGWLGAYDGWDIFVVIGISLRWLEGVGWGTYEGLKMLWGGCYFGENCGVQLAKNGSRESVVV